MDVLYSLPMPTTNPADRGKYDRPLLVPLPSGETLTVWIDPYAVFEAFKQDRDGNYRQCAPGDDAVAHAVKKLLCAGERGHKGRLQDLTEALICVQKAIDAVLLRGEG